MSGIFESINEGIKYLSKNFGSILVFSFIYSFIIGIILSLIIIVSYLSFVYNIPMSFIIILFGLFLFLLTATYFGGYILETIKYGLTNKEETPKWFKLKYIINNLIYQIGILIYLIPFFIFLILSIIIFIILMKIKFDFSISLIISGGLFILLSLVWGILLMLIIPIATARYVKYGFFAMLNIFENLKKISLNYIGFLITIFLISIVFNIIILIIMFPLSLLFAILPNIGIIFKVIEITLQTFLLTILAIYISYVQGYYLKDKI